MKREITSPGMARITPPSEKPSHAVSSMTGEKLSATEAVSTRGETSDATSTASEAAPPAPIAAAPAVSGPEVNTGTGGAFPKSCDGDVSNPGVARIEGEGIGTEGVGSSAGNNFFPSLF